jgi:hypothetical protein
MKKFTLPIIIVFFFSILSANTAFAQGWEFGGTIGGAVYRGDLDVNLRNFLPQMRPMIGIFGRYDLSEHWAFRTDLDVARVFVDEKEYSKSTYRQARGFSVNTNLFEINLQLQWLPIRLWDKVSFYTIGGVGFVGFNPKPNFNLPNPYVTENNPNLMRDRAGNYSRGSIVIPMGTGMRIDLNNDWVIGTEMSMRYAFTDYIDGMSYIVNSKTKDSYYFVNVLISKKFGGGDGLAGGRRGWSNSNGRGSKVRCYNF